jgi:hypothetical protein
MCIRSACIAGCVLSLETLRQHGKSQVERYEVPTVRFA